nr:uncharacterized protein LOC115267391 isoform X2 [Aedes albopictus]
MANKVITALSVVLFAFVISTTVLAVQKNDLEAENEELRAQLDSAPTEFSSTTTDTEETTLEPSAPTTTISMETSPAPTTVTTEAPPTDPPQDPNFTACREPLFLYTMTCGYIRIWKMAHFPEKLQSM